jgi:hypothetical protein
LPRETPSAWPISDSGLPRAHSAATASIIVAPRIANPPLSILGLLSQTV